jgi:hypothetical protein
MSHYKDEAKEASHAKMKRMGLHGKQKDASFDDVHPYDGVPQLDSGLAGMKPVGKQRFRRGGKVAHAIGKEHKGHLGHKPRKKADGGGLRSESTQMALANRRYEDAKAANEANVKDPSLFSLAKIPFSVVNKGFAASDRDTAKKETGMAAGGFAGNPNARKIVAALAMRKKRAGLPYAPPGRSMGAMPPMPMMGRKKGGSVHEDVAEDKNLIKSMVKPESLKHRAHKNEGGELWDAMKKAHENLRSVHMNPNSSKQDIVNATKASRATKDAYKAPSEGTLKTRAAGDYWMRDEKCWGGRSKRASGGRTGKGKATINIMVGAPHDTMAPAFNGGGGGSPPQQPMQPKPPGPPMQPQGPMGGPPPMQPPMMPPMMPPGGGGMPGMPGGQPPMGGGAPMGGMPGAGKPPMMPMGRKSGGRTIHQETEYGSGSGLGRLEKTKWPLAGATRKGGK